MNWNNYYMEQAGGGLNSNSYNIYQGKMYQKGYGLGGVFRKFFKWIKPIFKKHALPLLKESGRTLGKEALSSITDISQGLIRGENVDDIITSTTSKAIDNIKGKVEKKLDGNGIKGSAKPKKNTIFKKSTKKVKFKDIFS